MKYISPLFIFLFLAVLQNAFAQTPKVLIIGIDGCKPDVLAKAETPAIQALMENGAWTYKAKTDPISSSGICWTSMLTGVWHEKHKVVSNDYKNPNIKEYPHFFKRVKEFNPKLKTYSIANWAPIHNILKQDEADLIFNVAPDDRVTMRVVKALKEDNPDVVFVQLDQVDGAGHKFDYKYESEGYVKAIQKADKQVAEMVAAVKARETYEKEDWLIIVSTDHGGSNFGHGKDIPEHTTIFYIASGQSANKVELTEANVTDVCITAMKHLGMEIKAEWKLDGQVRGLK